MTSRPASSPVVRCPWPGIESEVYARYHDTEWGVPKTDGRALFEKLILEGFQSGLSWLTILRKRDAFRRAFDGFDPERVARYDKADVDRLMADAGIVRNRAKIEAAQTNARACLAIGSQAQFARFLWDFVDGRPVENRWRDISEVPSQTQASRRLAGELKRRGFRFVGPTTAYAFMQSVGMVNDHLVDCHRHTACSALKNRVKL